MPGLATEIITCVELCFHSDRSIILLSMEILEIGAMNEPLMRTVLALVGQSCLIEVMEDV